MQIGAANADGCHAQHGFAGFGGGVRFIVQAQVFYTM